MAEQVLSYPVLTDSKYSSVGYVCEVPEFSYTENYEEYPLQIDVISDSIQSYRGKLRDPRCAWYPDTHNLKMMKKCRLASAYTLFGAGGIASRNAIIGLALNWISTKSDERGIIPFGELKRTDSSKEFIVEAVFDRGKLRGSLLVQTVLYLKDPGKPDPDEMYFAQQSGTILGTIDQSEIYIDGNGSVFPISTVNEPGKPLWWVWYNEFADPMSDSFDYENVDIRINQAHPSYEALQIDNSLTESPLFLEVISAALVVIVESTRENLGQDWDRMLSGEGYETGSIAEAINYFYTRLGWDFGNASKLAISIKEFFEKNGRG